MSHFQSKEVKEQLSKPISNISTSQTGDQELLNFQRIRCDKVEPLRNEILTRLEQLRQKAEESHKMQWESKKRTDEINELKGHLHNLCRELNDERDNFTRLQTENSQLTDLKAQNESKLQRLNHMVEPIEHEVVFKENQRPETMQKYVSTHEGKSSTFKDAKDGKRHYKNSAWHKTMAKSVHPATASTLSTGTGAKTPLGVSSSAKHFGNGSSTRPGTTVGRGTGSALNNVPQKGQNQQEVKPSNVIKTVFLPNEQVNNLGMEIEILKNQLATDSKFQEQEAAFLMEERAKRQNEFQAKSMSDKDKIEQLRKKLAERQLLFKVLTKDLLDRRAVMKQKEVNYVQALNQVRADNNVLEKQVTEVSKKAVNEAENCQRLSELRTEDLISKFRSQSIKAQDNLKKAKESHNLLQSNMEQKVGELENKLHSSVDMQRRLERKRDQHVDEFMGRVGDLKHRMRNFEENFGRKVNTSNMTPQQKEEQFQDLREIRGEVTSLTREIKQVRLDQQ